MASRDRQAGRKAVAKRMVLAKKTAPKAPPARKVAPKKPPSVSKPLVKNKKSVAAKSVAGRPVPTAGKPQIVAKSPPAKVAKPAGAAAKPSASPMMAPLKPTEGKAASGPATPQQTEERRKAATRKFFARLRSLEAIVGADLRKRGSLVLMQAVDQWYSEAVSATATDISITNAAKAVISHL
jgi:hypothetical protein